MPRNYSSRDFFRQMPNALLARYFQERELFGDMDFAAMKEGKPDELFKAWLALPDSQRNKMDAEFRDIFEMSCEKGFRAIIDEANWQMRETPDDFSLLLKSCRPYPITMNGQWSLFWITIVSGKGPRSFIMQIHCPIGASARICLSEKRRWTGPAFNNWPR